MSDGAIPEDARQFLLKTIDSVAQWEAVLYLRTHSDRATDAAAVAGHLYISEADAVPLLEALVRRGVLKASDHRYAYAPKTPDLDVMISQVADLYRQYLIPVTNIIHSRPRSRVQEFANAFRIRKD
ncbi:hypothetical protein [Asticcacaulis solisilvae]|uniref:hypothetical protein n=1 Tax=Asticcacaulis solisilvae TaxID=1217274 RepID=UPI003FD83A9F